MLGRVDVAAVADIGGHRLRLPAIAADQEAAVGQGGGGAEEELLHPRFTVGQAVAEESEVAGEAVVRRHGMVRRGIERVVDRHALRRAEAGVCIDDGRAAAVGQDHVEPRQRPGDGVRGIAAHLVERRGGVDVPEQLQRVGAGVVEDTVDQFSVEHTDARRLHDDVGMRRLGEDGTQPVGGGGVDDRAGIGGRIDVAVLLPVEGVGLVEGDVVAVGGEGGEDAAVIGRGPVPVARQEAGAVEGDLHAAVLVVRRATMARSSSARWAQVWRVRMVWRPEAISASRTSRSSRIESNARSVSGPLRTLR